MDCVVHPQISHVSLKLPQSFAELPGVVDPRKVLVKSAPVSEYLDKMVHTHIGLYRSTGTTYMMTMMTMMTTMVMLMIMTTTRSFLSNASNEVQQRMAVKRMLPANTADKERGLKWCSCKVTLNDTTPGR